MKLPRVVPSPHSAMSALLGALIGVAPFLVPPRAQADLNGTNGAYVGRQGEHPIDRAISVRNAALLEEAIINLECARQSGDDVRVAVRAWRARAAGAEPLLNQPRSEAFLASCLADAYAFGAQNDVGARELTPVLRVRLHDSDKSVFRAAALGLARIGSAADMDAIVQAIAQRPDMSLSVLEMLSSVCNPLAPSTAASIIKLARSADEKAAMEEGYDPDRAYCGQH